MKTQLVQAAESPRGGASLISELLNRDPKAGKIALDDVVEEVLILMSQSPVDMANLFEWVTDDIRRVLWSNLPLKAIANMAQSPGDWERIRQLVVRPPKVAKEVFVAFDVTIANELKDGAPKPKWLENFRDRIKEKLGGKG